MTESEKAFLTRHGEIVLGPLLERWERSCGIKHDDSVSFEQRWTSFLRATAENFREAA